MKNIQTLEKEATSLTEIINILSEELRYNGTTEEVRKADCAPTSSNQKTKAAIVIKSNHSFW